MLYNFPRKQRQVGEYNNILFTLLASGDGGAKQKYIMCLILLIEYIFEHYDFSFQGVMQPCVNLDFQYFRRPPPLGAHGKNSGA